MIENPFIIFILGLLMLVYGSNFLIENSKNIASKFNISKTIIGITVVAFGTSLPELVVSIFAAMKNETAIIVGNVVGSNIANISLVLALIVIFKPIDIIFYRLKESIFYLFLSTSFVCVLMIYQMLNLFAGLLLLFLFITFIIRQFKNKHEDIPLSEVSQETISIKCIALIFIGIIALGYGSEIFIGSAIKIASIFNVPKIVISVSLVAFGTSLPELVTSVVALKKGETGFVIGNILGSNIINILLVLGGSLTINEIIIPLSKINISIYFLIIVTSIFLLIIFTQKVITKTYGIVLLIIYCIFIYFQFTSALTI